MPSKRIRNLRPRIYVSGPLSHGDQAQNCQRAISTGFDLMDLGYAPYVPHLSFFSDPLSTEGKGRYEQWIDLDLSFISTCHALVRLPGFSPGADREMVFAQSLNIPVFDSIEPLRCEKTRKRLIRRRIARNWYERNKNRNRLYSRRNHYKRAYGISVEQYNALYQAQGGVCAICQQPKKKNLLSIDHEHHTKVVRGLLCIPCNCKLGLLEDRAWGAWITQATEYLQAHQAREVPPHAVH